MSSGRAFHKVGALLENALYPYVLRLHSARKKTSQANIPKRTKTVAKVNPVHTMITASPRNEVKNLPNVGCIPKQELGLSARTTKKANITTKRFR